MENCYLLTFITTFAIFCLYYLDGKLSNKDRSTGDNVKTSIIVAGGVYLALMNHEIPKKVLKEIVEAGPANF